MSGPWFLRTEHLFLVPGDSPIGLRLPLDSIPWVSKSDYPYLYPHDPFDPSVSSPAAREAVLQPGTTQPRWKSETSHGDAERKPRPRESADWIVRTALCI